MRKLALNADELTVESVRTRDVARETDTPKGGMADRSGLGCPTDTIGRPCPP